jgi:4-hydroxy-tetrahydrodipicolinate synthase
MQNTAAGIARGAWPVMLTPFNEDRSIDWARVDEYTDWLIERGAAGIFTVALSSEMYDLTEQERVDLATRVVGRAAGRVPVVASSAVGGTLDAQLDSAKRIAATGVDAVILISSLLATPTQDEDELWGSIEAIASAVPEADLGVYECPIPYKRLPSLSTIRRMAESGRFVFYKDTSHSLELMRQRLDVVAGTRLGLYNAEMSSLSDSLRSGAAGFSGYAANIYPELVAWLCENVDIAPADDVLAVQRLLTVAEHAVNSGYPSAAKYFLARSSRVEMSAVSRWKPTAIGQHEGQPLVDLAAYIADLPVTRDLVGAR